MLCVWVVLTAWMYHILCLNRSRGGIRSAKTELQMVMSHHRGARDKVHDLWRITSVYNCWATFQNFTYIVLLINLPCNYLFGLGIVAYTLLKFVFKHLNWCEYFPCSYVFLRLNHILNCKYDCLYSLLLIDHYTFTCYWEIGFKIHHLLRTIA